MFAGERIPYTPPIVELPPDMESTEPQLPPPTSDCLGTYGGTICTEWEALHPKLVYNLSSGDLERPISDRPPPPSTTTDITLTQGDKYVQISSSFLCLSPTKSLSFCRDGCIVCVDGSHMMSGDGALVNSSCSANVLLHPHYVIHEESSDNIKYRSLICVFQPLR